MMIYLLPIHLSLVRVTLLQRFEKSTFLQSHHNILMLRKIWWNILMLMQLLVTWHLQMSLGIVL